MTGGSDFHGEGPAPEALAEQRLGRVDLPPEAWERFTTALQRAPTREDEP